MDSRTDYFSPSILYSSKNLFILENFNCNYVLWDLKGISGSHDEEVFDWLISSDLLPLNDPDIPIFLNHSSSIHSSLKSPLFPSSLSWELLQNLGSNHNPVLLILLLSSLFRPNVGPPFINFQKACWDDFAFHFDSYCASQKNFCLFLFPLLQLSLLH